MLTHIISSLTINLRAKARSSIRGLCHLTLVQERIWRPEAPQAVALLLHHCMHY